MTSLFRQGVESVCKGKRDRQRARLLAAEAPVWPDRETGTNARVQGQSRLGVALKAGGQAAPVVYPIPLLPTAGHRTSQACATWGASAHMALCHHGSSSGTVCSPLPDCRGRSGVLRWSLVPIHFTPSSHEMPFLALESRRLSNCDDVGWGSGIVSSSFNKKSPLHLKAGQLEQLVPRVPGVQGPHVGC